MENSVKQFIISNVFTYIRDIQVKDNLTKNGFMVGMVATISPFVFERLFELREYLLKNKVSWYVTTDNFPSYQFEMPCIRFYDDVEDDE